MAELNYGYELIKNQVMLIKPLQPWAKTCFHPSYWEANESQSYYSTGSLWFWDQEIHSYEKAYGQKIMTRRNEIISCVTFCGKKDSLEVHVF